MILMRLIEALWPVTYLAGLIITIMYFRRHGRPVFILLLVYFALGVYSHTLSRHVDQYFMSRSVSTITQKQIEKYEAYQKDLNDLQFKHPDVVPGTVVHRVQFPFGQLLLVVALFLIGRRINGKSPNTPFDATR